MTTENIKNQPPITFCFDDERIIKRMKEVGIWKQMQEARKAKTAVFILCNDELFIWHDCPTDSGYSMSKSGNIDALMMVILKVLSNKEKGGNLTRH